MKNLIELKNLSKKFKLGDNPFDALKDVNLSIKKGEFIAIIGQSGSGKSTLMNILGCLDNPSGGQYLLEEHDISKFEGDELARLRREKFGFIFQRYNLLSTLTTLQNVALPSVYAGVSKKDREKKAGELLEGLGLGEKLQNLPSKLSGGQQQRVGMPRGRRKRSSGTGSSPGVSRGTAGTHRQGTDALWRCSLDPLAECLAPRPGLRGP